MEMANKSLKGVRKLERPRPLRLNSEQDRSIHSSISSVDGISLQHQEISVEDVVQELASLHVAFNSGNYDHAVVNQITRVTNLLKAKGPVVDAAFKDQLDRYFVTLRNASRDDRLDISSRLRLLELIELRAMGWKGNENLAEYYKQKFIEFENYDIASMSSSSQSSYIQQPQVPAQITTSSSPPPPLQPGEVLRSSGKFVKPAKIPGRNFFKDEIIIRNSDSGKVMGIKGRRVHMIEELSDTIISFQRVNPGVRDRLVQITGPTEEAISHAKVLIEDTIRRNASPVRELVEDSSVSCLNYLSGGCADDSQLPGSKKASLAHSYSMSDASLGEYTYTVSAGRDTLRVCGSKANVVRTAKLLLERYFTGQADPFERNQMVSDQSMGKLHGCSPYAASDFSSLVTSRSATDFSRLVHDAACLEGCDESSNWGVNGPLYESSSSSSDEEQEERSLPQQDHVMQIHNRQDPVLMKSNSIVKGLPVVIRHTPLDTNRGQEQKPQNVSETSHEVEKASPSSEQENKMNTLAKTPELKEGACEKIFSYSRDFLLDCSQSPHSVVSPLSIAKLDIDIASMMVKQNPSMFDSETFRQRSSQTASSFDSQHSPSSTPPQLDVSESEEVNQNSTPESSQTSQ